MARFNANDADKYGGQGGGGYFSLKDDKETAQVRFLYDSIEDVEGYSVHEVEIDGKKRYVNCLRDYGDSMDTCPFCKAGKFTTAKFFVPLFNEDTGSVVVWERGKKFGAKLSSLCSRYPNLFKHTFEIERNGKRGDQQTTYEIYETGSDDNIELEDFELPKIIGGLVLDKTADEMKYFLDYEEFPDDGNNGVTRRESRRDARRGSSEERRVPRRDNGEREAF